MKQFFCLLLLFGFLAVPGIGFTADPTINCCCNITCTYRGGTTKIINECSIFYLLPRLECSGDKICALLGAWEFKKYTKGSYTGVCELTCPSQTVLGVNHPGLETLRSFRDTQLAKTAVGNKLKDLYYEYAGTLTEVLIENPSLGEHARELLEKLIPRIQASLKGRLKGPVLDAELYAEAEMLLDEIDSVITSPLKKDIMDLKDEARDAGLVE